MIRFISLLVSLPVIILVAAFAFKNAQLVSVDLFIYQVQLPLAVILLIVLMLGFVFGLLLSIVLFIRQSARFRKLKKQKNTLSELSGILGKAEK